MIVKFLKWLLSFFLWLNKILAALCLGVQNMINGTINTVVGTIVGPELTPFLAPLL